MDASRGEGVQAADPRQVRGRGQPLLLDRAAVGRRRHRPRRHARRARRCRWPPRSTPRDPGDEVRAFRMCRGSPRPSGERGSRDPCARKYQPPAPTGAGASCIRAKRYLDAARSRRRRLTCSRTSVLAAAARPGRRELPWNRLLSKSARPRPGSSHRRCRPRPRHSLHSLASCGCRLRPHLRPRRGRLEPVDVELAHAHLDAQRLGAGHAQLADHGEARVVPTWGSLSSLRLSRLPAVVTVEDQAGWRALAIPLGAAAAAHADVELRRGSRRSGSRAQFADGKVHVHPVLLVILKVCVSL